MFGLTQSIQRQEDPVRAYLDAFYGVRKYKDDLENMRLNQRLAQMQEERMAQEAQRRQAEAVARAEQERVRAEREAAEGEEKRIENFNTRRVKAGEAFLGMVQGSGIRDPQQLQQLWTNVSLQHGLDPWLNPPDEAIMAAAAQKEGQRITEKERPERAPASRRRIQGAEEIFEEEENGRWVERSRGPRWEPDKPRPEKPIVERPVAEKPEVDPKELDRARKVLQRAYYDASRRNVDTRFQDVNGKFSPRLFARRAPGILLTGFDESVIRAVTPQPPSGDMKSPDAPVKKDVTTSMRSVTVNGENVTGQNKDGTLDIKKALKDPTVKWKKDKQGALYAIVGDKVYGPIKRGQ